MAGRTSARSSASRDQASSPPKSTRRQAPTESQSPVMRSTRSTRSQSRDPHDDDTTTRRATRSRGARQGSVESTASIDTAASTDPIGKGKVKGKGKGKSKDERTGVVVANGLLILPDTVSFPKMLMICFRAIDGRGRRRIERFRCRGRSHWIRGRTASTITWWTFQHVWHYCSDLPFPTRDWGAKC